MKQNVAICIQNLKKKKTEKVLGLQNLFYAGLTEQDDKF